MLHLTYVIGAPTAGLGGALVAIAAGHIDPDLAYWTTSGEFVFVAILSGIGHVAAPLLGWPSSRHPQLRLPIFALQVADGGRHLPCSLVILFLPLGVWSLFAPAAPRARSCMNAPLIATSGLYKRFGAVVAVDNVTVEIAAGETVGIIGANGAGKTTFVNIVTGYLKPDERRHSSSAALISLQCHRAR